MHTSRSALLAASVLPCYKRKSAAPQRRQRQTLHRVSESGQKRMDACTSLNERLPSALSLDARACKAREG